MRERNLLGRGQDLRLGLTVSSNRQDVELSFTEPYFMDRNLAAGFDVFHRSRDLQDESSFDRESVGFALRAGYPLAEHLRHTVSYGLRSDEVSDVPANSSRFIRDQEGKTTTSTVSQSLHYDLRDSRIAPTDGYSARILQELAGIGGDAKYLKHVLSYFHYFPIDDGWVLAGLLRSGHIVGLDDDVRIVDRFFLGGSRLRGFESSGVGPPRPENPRCARRQHILLGDGGAELPARARRGAQPAGRGLHRRRQPRQDRRQGSGNSGRGLAEGLCRRRAPLPLAARADPSRLGEGPGEGGLRPDRDLPLQLRHAVLAMAECRRIALSLVLALAVVAGGGAGLGAQERGTRVAIIEMARILDETTALVSIQTQAEAQRAVYAAETQNEAQWLRGLQEELVRQEALLTPAALEERRRTFEAEVRAADERARARSLILQSALEDGERRFRVALHTVVAEVAERLEVEIVLPVHNSLYAVAGSDLTDRVIERLNEAFPEIALTFDES